MIQYDPLPKAQSPKPQQDKFNQAAIAEFQKGYVRLNLMADALKQAAGDEQQAQVLYLQQVALKLKQEQKIRTLLQQTPSTVQPSVGFFERCTDWLTDFWYIPPILLLVFFVALNNPQQHFQQAMDFLEFGQIASETTPSYTSSDQQQTDAHLHEQPIAFGIQQQYPALDPNHPAYQSALATQVQSLSQQYQQQGQPFEVAQQAAALSVLGHPHPANDRQVLSYVPRAGKVQIPTIEQSNTTPISACQHKPVMSNQDYLNCGLKPPNNTAEPVVEDFDPIL